MKVGGLRNDSTIVLSIGFVAVVLTLFYVLSYSPFITEAFLPPKVRIVTELSVLTMLLAASLRYQKVAIEIFWLVPICVLFNLMILFGTSTPYQLVSSFNKLLFLILMIVLLAKNRRVLELCMNSWVAISFVACVISLVGFAAYTTGLISFDPYDFGLESAGVPGSYYYLHHSILGNLTPRRLFGYEFGRITGYMFEPSLLAFYFGFNILVAREWVDNQKARQWFVWLNAAAGFLTLSSTFIIFFVLYLSLKYTVCNERIGRRRGLLLLFMVLASAVIAFVASGYLHQTSGIDRIERMQPCFDLLEGNSPVSFLLGNGVGVTVRLFSIGIDSGWLALLVERGMLTLVLMAAMFMYLTRYNMRFALFVVFYNLAFSLFWSPLFLLLIAISFADYKWNVRRIGNNGSRQEIWSEK